MRQKGFTPLSKQCSPSLCSGHTESGPGSTEKPPDVGTWGLGPRAVWRSPPRWARGVRPWAVQKSPKVGTRGQAPEQFGLPLRGGHVASGPRVGRLTL